MIFRVARHTNKLVPIIEFYTQILNLEELGHFKNHVDYSGVFLGKKELNWHLEFTISNTPANHTFDEDDILVFYPKTYTEYQNILANIEHAKIKKRIAKNPYWKENGVLIQDPDSYNIIISDRFCV